MKEKRGSAASLFQAGSSPVADATHKMCCSSGLLARFLLYTAKQQHNVALMHFQIFLFPLQVNFCGMNTASLEYKQFVLVKYNSSMPNVSFPLLRIFIARGC